MITPDREVRVEVVIELDSGSIGNFIGYRVQHDNARGPFKGGSAIIRPSMLTGPVAGQPDDMENRARSILSFGGAKGGINCDPDKLSRGESAPHPQVHRENP